MQDNGEREILENALRKAHENGWRPTQFEAADIPYIDRTWRNVMLTRDFAKALWGEKEWRNLLIEERLHPEGDLPQWDGGPEWFEFTGVVWQYHLQQMVIADDPIKYLGENI